MVFKIICSSWLLKNGNHVCSYSLPPDGIYKVFVTHVDNGCKREIGSTFLVVINGKLKNTIQFYWYRGDVILAQNNVTVQGMRLPYVVEMSWIQTDKEYVTLKECLESQSEIISNLRKKLAQVEKQNDILQELVDRPDGIGSRIAYQEVKNLLV